MDIKPGATFEPEDFNPLGEPDPAAVQQAGEMPAPPPAPVGPPEGAVGGYGTPPASLEAGQFGTPPPAPASQFGSPAAPTDPGQQFNQFGSPMAPQQGQFGGDYTPPPPPPMPDYGAPGQGRLAIPGAVPATEQVKNWNASTLPKPSEAARRSMVAGLIAFGGFAASFLLPGGVFSFVFSTLVVVLGIYAIATGHRGLRDARRGQLGKAEAVVGLIAGYLTVVAMTIGTLLVVAAILGLVAFVSTTGIGVPGTEDVPPSVHTVDVVSAADLSAGDCMLDPWDTANVRDTLGNSFQVVPCSAQHAAEVIYVDLDPTYGHPEEDETAELRCYASFEDYMSVPYDESEYYFELYSPTLDEWNSGDASVVCAVYFGYYLTGSQAGSGV